MSWKCYFGHDFYHDQNIVYHDQNIAYHDQNIVYLGQNLVKYYKNIIHHSQDTFHHGQNIVYHNQNVVVSYRLYIMFIMTKISKTLNFVIDSNMISWKAWVTVLSCVKVAVLVFQVPSFFWTVVWRTWNTYIQGLVPKSIVRQIDH